MAKDSRHLAANAHPKKDRSEKFASYLHAQLSREKEHVQNDLSAKLGQLKKIKREQTLLALKNSITYPDSGRGLEDGGASPLAVVNPINPAPPYLKANNSLSTSMSKVSSLPRIVFGPEKVHRDANGRASLDEANLKLNKLAQ